MDKSAIDISFAMNAFSEGNKPITSKETAGFVASNITTFTIMSDNRRAILYEGHIEKVGYTFHPLVTAFIRLDYNSKHFWYEKSWLGWKQRPYEWERSNINEMESTAGVNILEITNVDVLFSEGSYYPVHVGKVLRHHMHEKPCEYCEISDAHKWVEQYKRYGLKHEATRWMPGKEEAKKALRKYPKQLKEFFGADTVERLLNDLSKKR
jgi:hypothetical protein